MSRGRVVNYGVSAGHVTAGVMAVGRGAKAVGRGVRLDDRREELAAALDQFREALRETPIDASTRKACEREVEGLEAEARKDGPDPDALGTLLGRVASRLRGAGVVLRETLALREPIETIAGLIGTSLSLLKLW